MSDITQKIGHKDAIDAAYRAADLLGHLCQCPAKLKRPYEPYCYLRDCAVQDKAFCNSERAACCWASYIFGEIVADERFKREDNWQEILKRRNESIAALNDRITSLTKDRDAWMNRCGIRQAAIDKLPDYLSDVIPEFLATKVKEALAR